MLRMSLTRLDPPARHRPPTRPCLHLPSSAPPRIRLDAFKRPFRAWQERRYAPTNLPVVTMWASNRGVSRRMGVGVNAFCSLNSISTTHETLSSTRPQPWVMYGMVGAWPLSTSKSNTYYLDPFGRCKANPSPLNQICTRLSSSWSREMYSYRSSA
ncbi:hypothetical protein EDB85DRAFT_2015083 [Lactarius pseudohatsudake]|nr:hypothetical protein EDB85DRAFT_2015083 [Lactarius pseudohatsudake]